MSAADAPSRVLYQRAEQRAYRDTRPRPQPIDHSEEHLLRLAVDGVLVAEELPTKTRERLFTHLHWLGWTDHEIAEHTRTTEYTTARILRRLGLAPNRPRAEGMTA